jgi:lipoprotein-releasing system ATP-binding protein
MAMVEVKNLFKKYGEYPAVNGVSLEFETGGQYVIRGSSGSGKSTLLYMLAGLESPTEGEIYVESKSIHSLDDSALSLYRNQYVGLVFQFHFLLPSMNCLDNILLPARIGGTDDKKKRLEVLGFANKLGVEHCLKKYPFELSGGEQQRVNIIRALSQRPKLLLCDEPTGNLDSANGQLVTDLLKDLATEFNSTLVVVTHDEKVASQFSKSFFLKDGRVEHHS